MATRRRLGRYLAEFVVVFLGVWLSLLAEQFRQGRADRARETQALSAIAADLESDSVVVAATIERATTGLEAAARLLAGDFSATEAPAILDDIGVCSFTGSQRTSRYEALRTGELGFVRDPGVRSRIEALYFESAARDYLHARDCDAAERFLELIGPSAEMSVPPVERANAIPGWRTNDRPTILALRTLDIVRDAALRSHIAVMSSERQFLRAWLEREMESRSRVLAEIRTLVQ